TYHGRGKRRHAGGRGPRGCAGRRRRGRRGGWPADGAAAVAAEPRGGIRRSGRGANDLNTLVIARFTLHEAVSRRLILAALLLSVAFLGLFLLGFSFVYGKAVETAGESGNRLGTAVAASILTMMGL